MDALPKRLQWVKDEFDRQSIGGVLGDPDGQPAMAYLRVSSIGQAEEGRTGFPRQLVHVHEKARTLRLAIPWNLLFFDDHTGFAFRDRPALTRLRNLVKSRPRPADDLVIENLDRLSREATWHQGFLLDELEKECKVKVHFWKELGSTLERVVYGTVAQDRMLTDLERMANGNILKAKSRRVTAHVAAFGYKLVNANGGEENAKKDTHYGIHDPEADIVRTMYAWLVEEHATLHEISRRLVARHIQAPKKSKTWEISLIYKIIKNPVYKGEFYAHRTTLVRRISKYTGKEVMATVERPKSEWILVPVPALVSSEIWERAQQVVKENRNLSLRNSKGEYLLQSLAYCPDCNFKFHARPRYETRMLKHGPKQYDRSFYMCGGRDRRAHLREALGNSCMMPRISQQQVDPLVWSIIVNVLLDPERLNNGIERFFAGQVSQTTRDEIGYVQGQLTNLELEDELLYQAYVAKAFDADEFARRRYALKAKKEKLEIEKEELQRRLANLVDKQERKSRILGSAEELRKKANEQTPFELRRKILMLVVDKIFLNSRDRWLVLEGAIAGKFDFTSARVSSWPCT